jgi:hypothetical protein
MMAPSFPSPLASTTGLSRVRSVAMFAKRGDSDDSFLEQHTCVALSFLRRLLNLPAKFSGDAGKTSEHVVAGAGESFIHFLSKVSDFCPHVGTPFVTGCCEAGLHLTAQRRGFILHHATQLFADRRKPGLHFGAYGRKVRGHVGSELSHLQLHRTHAVIEGAHALTEPGHVRGQFLQAVHCFFQPFYAIHQRLARHRPSARRVVHSGTTAFDAHTGAKDMPLRDDDVSIVRVWAAMKSLPDAMLVERVDPVAGLGAE